MFNYFKFALYQIIGFLASVFKLLKIKKDPKSLTDKDIFNFLQSHATKSLNLVDIKLTIKGKERIPKQPVLFVMNHSSMLDSFIVFASVNRPIGVVIADEPIWRNIPIVSKWTNYIKCVYINRKNTREGMKSINKAANNILDGHSMAIFPEGDLTWVKDSNALVSDFRNGALKIAYKAKCPIVPLVLKNTKETYDGYQPIGKIHSLPVEVEFLEPIYKHIENPKFKSVNLGDEIKESMINSIKEYLENNN